MGISIKSMWTNKCPRCREGKIFSEPFSISDPLKMPKRCKVCNQATEPEPGFYFGAMFLSYILSSWFLLLPTLLLIFYFNWSTGAALTFTIILTAITYLKFLRGCRSLWLHMNIKFDPEVAEQAKQEAETTANQLWIPNIKKTPKSIKKQI